MNPVTIAGEPSFRVETPDVTFAVTEWGGQLGPVIFDLGDRLVQPYHLAPWAGTSEAATLPPILRALRGDFFCLPFGSNEGSFQGELHPLHGETANERWRFAGLRQSQSETSLTLELETKVRPGVVTKQISIRPRELAVYQTHRIEGMAGPMSFGHHAMLEFPASEGSGLVSVSPFRLGKVFPGEFERAELGGYSSLARGAEFATLAHVPNQAGGFADLSRYPARAGYEDLVMVGADPVLELAWSAAAFPSLGYVWLSIRASRTLPSTVLWLSNGGRHYPPWRGRHRYVLGIEDVCSYFHFGLSESASPNSFSERGIRTFVELQADVPLEVRTIHAVHPIPDIAAWVAALKPEPGKLRIEFSDGRTDSIPLDLDFLYAQARNP